MSVRQHQAASASATTLTKAQITRYDTSCESSSPLVPAPSSAPPLNSAWSRNNRVADVPSAAVPATFIVTSTRPPPDTVSKNAPQNAVRFVIAANKASSTAHDASDAAS